MDSQLNQIEAVPPAANESTPRSGGLLEKALFGPHGFRAGWPVAVGLLLGYFLLVIFGSIAWSVGANNLHLEMKNFGAMQNIVEESAALAALIIAASIASRMDGRRLPDYFLRDDSTLRHGFTGAIAGFVSLSLLVAALGAAGWLHLRYGGLTPAQDLRFAIVWAVGFLLVSLTEEGSFRCFLLGTLERGMNFWWAAASVVCILGFMLANPDRHGAGGVYTAIVLGAPPCAWLQWRKSPSSQFWQTSWATSAAFGFVHTYNNGETAAGVFATALIGFTFCFSIRMTGSAWWAIGFHGAWDWAQTYFYGTPDSGLIPEGHLLSSTITGPAFWNGGKAGPEGSVLAIPLTVLILVYLFFAYRNRQLHEVTSPVEQAQLS